MQELNTTQSMSAKEEKIMISVVETHSVVVLKMKEPMIKKLKLSTLLMLSNIKRQLLPNLNSLDILKDI